MFPCIYYLCCKSKIEINSTTMSFKSAYKSQEIESRLEKGYYDDITGRGFDGTKDELDARLAHASVCVFWNRVPDASDLSFQSGDV